MSFIHLSGFGSFSMRIRSYRCLQVAMYTVSDAESDGDDENDLREAPEEKME